MNEDADAAFEAGIAAALGAGELTTRWLVIAESIGEDGKRGLWLRCHPDMKSWDVLGMLHFALNLELSKEIAEHLEPE